MLSLSEMGVDALEVRLRIAGEPKQSFALADAAEAHRALESRRFTSENVAAARAGHLIHSTMSIPSITFPTAPYRLSGLVIGSLMNHGAALAALGDTVHQAPYKAAPKGPILYVKPRNTWSASGDVVVLPQMSDQLEVGASLGLVIGRTACGVSAGHALDHIAGYTLVADLFVPHESFYRPSIRFKALDGSCFVGPRVALRHEISNPDDIAIHVSLNGVRVQSMTTSGMVRPARRLIADASEFMTLRPGDILMLGIAIGTPRVRANECFVIETDAIGRLEGRVLPRPPTELT